MPRKLGMEYPGAIYHVIKGENRMARWLRKETRMSLKWMAQRLQMGSEIKLQLVSIVRTDTDTHAHQSCGW